MKRLQKKLERQRGESWLEDELWIAGASPSARLSVSVPYGSYREREEEEERERALLRPMEARNERQKKYINLLQEKSIHILISTGPAGTGKTLLATGAALRALRSNHFQRIVITRPAVSVDEEHGFLPGDIEAKMDPWLQPIFDAFRRYYTMKEVRKMMDQGIIEIVPLAYMRGRTFVNAFIIADEMQNASKSQFMMLLTRIGEGSKMVVTGDPQQQDRPRGPHYAGSGLDDFLCRYDLQRAQGRFPHGLRVFRFGNEDVVRHEVVKTVLRMYEDPTAPPPPPPRDSQDSELTMAATDVDDLESTST